jgi:hypothetical protein
MGAICLMNDGKPTGCKEHDNFGKNYDKTRRILRASGMGQDINQTDQPNYTCAKCADPNCDKCGDNYKLCNECKAGFANNKEDPKSKCNSCNKNEC